MQKDLCEKCVKRRDRIRELNRGKRPEHSPDFTSGQIEEIDRLQAEGRACDCWRRRQVTPAVQRPSMPGWEALEYAARTLESAEQSLRQMGAYGNADILHPATVWLRGLEQQAQEKRHG